MIAGGSFALALEKRALEKRALEMREMRGRRRHLLSPAFTFPPCLR